MILKQGKQDLLQYYVFDSRKNAGMAAGNDIADAILSMLEEKEELNMIFAAAPSQNETLASLLERKEIPWNRIHAFHMDEYIGLSEDAPQRFGNFLKDAIFGKVDFKSVNYIDGGAEDIEAECLDEICRNQQVNDGCFATLSDVPTHALTLTIPALVSARVMFCTVPAATKRWAVKETVQGVISEECPATIMRRHDHAILYCDSQSGADLL